ncbi:undecaprenyl-diphosphate phosphatase [Candidatus Saccharibacteria bacterium]|jgi:undecaprenyl-diphosphatase uppP|nr:undecaprenyl-diphosphate phosphatase [Candidatus Saccharibacteria bacterium]
MHWLHAAFIGIVEGITEFLPVSSTAHITVLEQLFNYKIDDPSVTAFTAVVQMGAILAAILYFRKDIVRIGTAWFKGITSGKKRSRDYKFGWAIIIGSLPIVVVGLLLKDVVEQVTRNMWWLIGGMLVFSLVMWVADRIATGRRGEHSVTTKDMLIIGAVQVLSLVPGVSRSGATTASGLLQGFDRVTVTKLSFFLGIPALFGAGLLETASHYKDIAHGVGWGSTMLATIVSFIVGYLAIDWLLKFVARHSFSLFIWYRIVFAIGLVLLLAVGAIKA